MAKLELPFGFFLLSVATASYYIYENPFNIMTDNILVAVVISGLTAFLAYVGGPQVKILLD